MATGDQFCMGCGMYRTLCRCSENKNFGFFTRASVGWLCPKCGRGNAPFVTQCSCGPAYETTVGSGTAETFWPSENK